MFSSCADPKSLEGISWLLCYLTSGKHIDFYWSFLTVFVLLAVTAPAALLFGFGGAMAARSHVAPLYLKACSRSRIPPRYGAAARARSKYGHAKRTMSASAW